MSTKQKQEDDAFSTAPPEPVGDLTIVALERDGWEFYQEDDQSWVGDHDGKNLRSSSGIAFTKEDAVRAVLVLMRKQEAKSTVPATGTIPEKWFRKAPVPDDPNSRLVEDLNDRELADLLGHYGENTGIGKALKLEIELRDEEFSSGGQTPKTGDVPEAEESDDDWFLNYELPNSMVMSDLEAAELQTIIDGRWLGLPDEAKLAAENLIAYRKERDLAEHLSTVDVTDLLPDAAHLSQQVEPAAHAESAATDDQGSTYATYRAEAKGLTLSQLLKKIAKFDVDTTISPYKRQASNDEMNVRMGQMSVDDSGNYAWTEDVEEIRYLGPTPDDQAYIALLNTSMGWIFGYEWCREKSIEGAPLNSFEIFPARVDALKRAAEIIEIGNEPELSYPSAHEELCARLYREWAHSLAFPGEIVEAEIVEDVQPLESSLDVELSLVPAGQNDLQVTLFDYSVLDAATAVYVQEREDNINNSLKRSLSESIKVGNWLEECFQKLEGHFELFVTTRFSMSVRWARDCRKIAKVFDGVTGIEKMPWKALVALAQDDVPKELRAEIVEDAQAGKTITTQTVTTKIKEVKEVEQARSPHLPGIQAPAPGAGLDITGAEEIESSTAELVASGRTTDDMVSLLKATPSGVSFEQLITMGFSDNQISAAQTDRKIEKRDLRYFYRFTPEDVVAYLTDHGPQTLLQLEETGFSRYAIEAALMDGDIVKSAAGIYSVPETAGENSGIKQVTPTPQPVAPIDYKAMLKGREMVITVSYVPALPEFLNLSVRVGDDVSKTTFSMPDFTLLNKLPKEILQVVTEQIERADKEKPAKKAPAKKESKVVKSPSGRSATSTATKTPAAKTATKKAPVKAEKKTEGKPTKATKKSAK